MPAIRHEDFQLHGRGHHSSRAVADHDPALDNRGDEFRRSGGRFRGNRHRCGGRQRPGDVLRNREWNSAGRDLGRDVGLGSHSATASASDHAGNTGTKSFGFTVADTTPPALSLTTIPPSTIKATSSGGAAVDFAAANTDVVDGSDPVTFSETVNGTAQAVTSGETFGLGSHIVTASASDHAGNTSTKSFSFTVAEPTPHLVIAFDPNVTFSSATSATLTGTVSDNVGVASVTLFAGDPRSEPPCDRRDLEFLARFRPGSHTGISAVATDTSGNSASAPSDFDLTTGTRSGIPGQPYTAYQDRYAADGTFLGQTFFKANGAELFASTYTALPNGGSSYTYSGGTFFKGKTYSSFVNIYDANDTLIEDIENNRNGSHTIGIGHDRGGYQRAAGAQHRQRSLRQRCA